MKLNELSFKKFFTESLSRQSLILIENLGTLKELPSSWIKQIVSGGLNSRLGGKNSELIKLSGGEGIKNISRLRNLVNSALKEAEDGKYPFVWISVNGEPIFGIEAFGGKGMRTEYKVFTPEGRTSVTDTERLHWTGKMMGRGEFRKYVPLEFRKVQRTSLKKNEAFDTMVYGIIGTVKNIMGIDASDADINKFMGTQNIELKAVTVDEVRAQLRSDRKASRTNIDSIIQNRKEVIKKFTKQRISPLVNRIKSGIPTEEYIDRMIDSAMEGKGEIKNISFSRDVIEDINRLSAILSQLNNAIKRDNLEFAQRKSFMSGRNDVELDYSVRFLIKSLKGL